MVSVLIATFFWGNLAKGHEIRHIKQKVERATPICQKKWCRLTAVAATVCPPRHIEGERQKAAAAAVPFLVRLWHCAR